MKRSIPRSISLILAINLMLPAVPILIFGEEADSWDYAWTESAEAPEPGSASSPLYGYVESTASVSFDGETAETGFATVLRLKGEWLGSSPVTARIELLYREQNGVQNPVAMFNSIGLNPAAGLQAENPQDSFLESLEIDHAWAVVNLGSFDLSLGKMPVAWGTALLYNPTDRLGAVSSLDGRGGETAGTTAVVPVWYPGGSWAVEGTAVFRQRGIEGTALIGSMDPENIPLGLKVKGYAGGFDFSLSAIREVWYTGLPGGFDTSVDPPATAESWERNWYIGMDAIGQAGPFGLYLEGTFNPDKAADLVRTFDLAAGIELNPGKVSLKAEYIRSSAGDENSTDYRPELLLSGRSFFLARNYLFLYANRTLGDYLEITGAGIINLDDLSVMLTSEVVYPFLDNFELTAAGSLPFGPDGSEYALDFMIPEISIGLKASF